MITNLESTDKSIEIRNAKVRLYDSDSDIMIYGSSTEPDKIINSLVDFLKSRGNSSASTIKMDSEGAALEAKINLIIAIRKNPQTAE